MSRVPDETLYVYAFERPEFDPLFSTHDEYYVYAQSKEEAIETMEEVFKMREEVGQLKIPKGWKPKFIRRMTW